MALRFALVLFCLLGLHSTWAASIGEHLDEDLQSPQAVTNDLDGETLHLPAALSDYYQHRAGAPVWVDDHGPLPRAWAMLDAIRAAGDDGLNPLDYHLHALDSLFTATRSSWPHDDQYRGRLAAMDLLLSDGFLLLCKHELSGRAKPAEAALLTDRQSSWQDLESNLDQVAGGTSPDVLVHA